MKMKINRAHYKMELLWALLIVLTLGSRWLIESSDTNIVTALIICVLITFKGQIVIDYFIGLKRGNRPLRYLMRLYFYLIPLLVFMVYLLGQQ